MCAFVYVCRGGVCVCMDDCVFVCGWVCVCMGVGVGCVRAFVCGCVLACGVVCVCAHAHADAFFRQHETSQLSTHGFS